MSMARRVMPFIALILSLVTCRAELILERSFRQLDPEAQAAWATPTEARLTQDRWVYDDLSRAAHVRLRLAADQQPEGLKLRVSILDGAGTAVAEQILDSLEGPVIDLTLDVASLKPGRYTTRLQITGPDGNELAALEHPLIREAGPAAPPTAGAVPVKLARAGGGLARTAHPVPVTFGVAMPRGACPDARVRLLGPGGAEIPSQSEVTATWEAGGSAKWLLVTCVLPPGLDEGAELTLEYGADPTPPATPLTINETNETFEVTTGPARFTIRRDSFDLISRAWLDADGDGQFSDAEAAITLGVPQGPYVVDQDGVRYRAADDDQVEVSIERRGAIEAVICARGWYVAEDGSRLCRHVTRLHAYAGLPWLRVMHTFIFTEDSTKVKLADIALTTAVTASLFRFGVPGDDLRCPITSAETTAWLLQDEHNHWTYRHLDYPRADGERADGWVGTQSSPVSLSVGVRDFWQNYPKELEVGQGAMTVHLWPAHNTDPPTQPLTDGNLSDLWFIHHGRLLDFQVPEWFYNFKGQREDNRYRYVRSSVNANGLGVARTHELLYVLQPAGASPDADMALLQEPATLVADAEWMCASGAAGPLAAAEPERFPLAEQAMSLGWDGERAIEQACQDWGMFNFGGAHTYFDYALHDYDRLERPWRLNHHGGPRVPWLMYLRTGDLKYLDWGCRNTRRLLDIAWVHHTLPEFAALPYPQGKIVGATNDYKGIVPWHSGSRLMDYNSMTDFMFYYYYLTGDRWAVDVADEWGTSVKHYFSRPGAGRQAAGTVDAVLDIYKATWDEDYREIAEAIVTHLISTQEPDGNFPLEHWYTYAPWLSDYWWLTGGEDASAALVRWADGFTADRIRNESGTSYSAGYAYYDVLADAYRITGDEKYLARGLGNMTLISNSVYSDPESILYAACNYSGHSLYGYFHQTVPYLMRELETLDELPDPVFAPWLLGAAADMDIYLLDEIDEPLTIEAGMRFSSPIAVSVLGPGGEALSSSTIQPNADDPQWPEPPATYSIRVPTDGRTGPERVRLHCDAPFYMQLPVRPSRPVRLVFGMSRGLEFVRGSAVYLMVPEGAERLSLSMGGRDTTGHTAALYDPKYERVAFVQWYGMEQPGPHRIAADCPQALRGRLWLFLQGLSKSMNLTVETPGVPPFFADRPERWFEPPDALLPPAP